MRKRKKGQSMMERRNKQVSGFLNTMRRKGRHFYPPEGMIMVVLMFRKCINAFSM